MKLRHYRRPAKLIHHPKSNRRGPGGYRPARHILRCYTQLVREDGTRYKPWIWRRLLTLALLCCLIPVGILALVTVFAPFSGAASSTQIASQVAQEARQQVAQIAGRQADYAGIRLSRIGYAVKLLGAYAEEVLGSPQVFAEQVAPGLFDEPEEEDTGETAEAEPPPLDNPLFYATSDDGAIRKLIDDGRTAVYFAVRSSGEYSRYDMQRLHATVVLDPLLMEPVRSDPLCTQAFLITRDDLLRTYPFRDFTVWPPDRDLSKPRDFWNEAKADADGLVWTTPYVSALTETWVVACMSPVRVADRLVAVTGCEIDVTGLAQATLSAELGPHSTCWLIKPVFGDEGEPARWLVLAAQDGAVEALGVTALDTAELPTDKHTGADILDEADILAYGKPALADVLRQQLSPSATTLTELLPDISVMTDQGGNFVAAAPVTTAGWVLAGLTESPALLAVERYESQLDMWRRGRLLLVVAIGAVGLLLAFALAWLEARRLTQPLSILTQAVRQAASTRRTSAVTLSDEGEIGALAVAVQELIDATTTPANGNSGASRPDSADDSSAAD